MAEKVLGTSAVREGKLTNREMVAEGTYEVEIGLDDDFNFIAGQYLWLVLPKLNYEDPKGERRAFSICSSPGSKRQLAIVFRSSDSGFKKTLLELPLGSSVQILGPFGSFLLPKDTTIPVTLIAGGTGISPFMSMLRDEVDHQSKRKINFIFANKSPQRALYVKELTKIMRENSNLTINIVYGQIDSSVFKDKDAAPLERQFYLSGPEPMVQAVGNILLGMGIKDGNIMTEEYHLGKVVLESPLDPDNSLASLLNTFKLAVESSSNHIVITDTNGVIKYANSAASLITGFSQPEMLGQTPRLWGGLMEGEFYRNLWKTIKFDRRAFVSEVTNRKKDGTTYVAIARISPIFSEDNRELIGFLGTEEDITNIKVAENRLKEIVQEESEFLSVAAHQLRTPLTSMRWDMDLILGGDLGELSAPVKEKVQQIYDSNKRIIGLVNDLLDISRIEQGRVQDKPEMVQIEEVIGKVVAENLPLAQTKKIKLTFSQSPTLLPKISIDPKRLYEVISNLVSNAIKYNNRPQGVVDVVITGADESFIVTVADNGMGIPESEKSRIFGRFYRGRQAIDSDIEGTGLGLAVVKAYAESWGGKVWFESSEEKGSTFHVRLPFKIKTVGKVTADAS